jgi:hypothetical protein
MKIRLVLLFALLLNLNVNAQSWGDYTLYSTMGGQMTYLLDTNNVTYHSWIHGSTKKTGYSSYLLPGGELLRTVSRAGNSFSGGPICGEVQKLAWDGTVLWDYVYSTTSYCSHHDIHPMPNGNVLIIAYERKTAADVAAAGCNTFANEMWPDKIVEVEPVGATGGNIVWEWHAWDHLVQNVNPSLANYQTSIVDHPELLNINYGAQKDWMHMNGVSYNPILDQVAFSCHNLNEMYIIDHSTTTAEAASHSGGNSGKGGDILYRWGKPAVYSAAGAQILKVVHDAHWIPEGSPNAGYMVGFNNQGISTSQSCVDHIITPRNNYNYDITIGQAFTPSTYTTRTAAQGYTSNMGSSQQLPSGNELICVATSGYMYEVTPTNVTVWSKTASGSVPKAWRYSACYVSNAAPPIPVITEAVQGILSSTSAVTYQWYLNGNLIVGATSQDYTPTQDGMYVVRITDVNGCVNQYSEGYYYQSAVGVNEIASANGLNIFPNPSSGIFTLDYSNLGKDYTVSVYSAVGNLVKEIKNSATIDMSSFGSGIYYVSITSQHQAILNKKISIIK